MISLFLFQMKSVLKPPNPHTQKKSSLNKTGLVEQHSSVSKRTAKSPATSGYRGPHTNDRSDAEERTRRLHGGTRSDLPPQMHYLESSACKLPELTAKEWKQVCGPRNIDFKFSYKMEFILCKQVV